MLTSLFQNHHHKLFPEVWSQLSLILKPHVPHSRRVRQLEQDNRLAEIGLVDRIRHHIRPLIIDHELRPLGTQRPQVNVGAILNLDHMLLTALGAQTRRGVPVLEEIVQPCPVHEDGRGIDQPQPPGARTVGRRRVAIRPRRIVPRRVGVEARVQRVRVALIIRRLLLDGAHEDVARIDELIIEHGRVFGRRAVKPQWALGAFEQETPAQEGRSVTSHPPVQVTANQWTYPLLKMVIWSRVPMSNS